MKLRVSILLVVFCLLTNNAFLQVNIGKILSYKIIPGGIKGKTSHGTFQLSFYSPHIVRVQVTNKSKFSELPYALQDSIQLYNQITVFEKRNEIFISTQFFETVVEKHPSLRILFKNKKGAIINEDVNGEGFGISYIADRWSIYKKIQNGERFVGMGEALGNLDRKGTGISLNNTDTYKYGDPRLSMYSSVPFYMGFHQGQQYGIFYNNSYLSFFNFGLSTPSFVSATFMGGDVDYFFIYDHSPAKIIEHYTYLTGRIQLPPVWSLGYHQSRCSYFTQSQVEWIASSFRSKNIPIDCIVLDADYQYNYQPFRTNKDRFPDLPMLARKLSAQQIELTASVYPGIAIDTSYHVYRDGINQNVFLKHANGEHFITEISPVKCVLPDFTNPITRSWWRDKMKWFSYNGINGIWNDMNEPAIGGSFVPDNVIFNFDGRKTNALEAKNAYAFQMARSSYEAALQNSTFKRPFILTRSGFAGVQRYAALWSGDNTASDEGLLTSVLLNNQLGLSGIAFCGYDIGGFIGDGNKELYQRWIQVGVFSPFCRNHKGCGGVAGEPWAYGDEAEAISKSYISLRYRLLPYLYATFYEASQTGLPIARSLCIENPFDEKVYNETYQYQFLFGQNLLVVPVTSTEKQKRFYLPKGEWYNLYTDENISGNNELQQQFPSYQLPLYVKASAIIPMQHQIQSTKQSPSDTLLLHIYNGTETGSFTYYEDAGDGWGYQNKEFYKRIIRLNPAGHQLELDKPTGHYPSKFKKIQIVFHGFKKYNSVTVNQKKYPLASTFDKGIFNPLEYLKNIYEKTYLQTQLDYMKAKEQQTVVLDFDSNHILVEWPD